MQDNQNPKEYSFFPSEMNASELNRKLLYCGYEDIADYLRNSPFNRCVYNIIVGYGPKPMVETPMVEIFNEVYYQCVRVNFDSDPGVNLEKRYVKEEETWLESRDAARLVFGVVWGFLRCKDARTFNEECFVDRCWPLISRWKEERLSYVLIKFTIGDRIYPPSKYHPRPCPVSELVSTYNDEDCEAWREVTNNFSQKTIEHYLEIYEKVEDQHALLELIERAYRAADSKNRRVSFSRLREAIANGDFHQAADNLALYEEGMDLNYKEELERLKKKFEYLKKQHRNEKSHIKEQYEYEINRLRKELEEMALEKRRQEDPRVLLFSFSEMVEIVKARFSNSAANEFCNLLYNLATKHGYLNEEISKTIDGIVPAVLNRETIHQTIEFNDPKHVYINPKEVKNITEK